MKEKVKVTFKHISAKLLCEN